MSEENPLLHRSVILARKRSFKKRNRGRRIVSLVNIVQNPGSHELSLRGIFRAKGTYVQVFTAGEFVKKGIIVMAKRLD